MQNAIKPRQITIGITGSISAYKIADVVSALKKIGIQTQCLLSESGSKFVTATTLETLSGQKILTDLFDPQVSGTEHIRLARETELFVVAPATANVIAKLAHGLADDWITTVALATRAPILVVPAMNWAMWEHPATQANVETLKGRGIQILGPEMDGVLACGEEGAGKLVQPDVIVAKIIEMTSKSEVVQDLLGTQILITSGPTISRLDAVRYMTNGSTGKMGAQLAEEAIARGATVHYVTGKDKGVVMPQVKLGSGGTLNTYVVETAEEMLDRSLKVLADCQFVIAASAVLDYRVKNEIQGKEKRASEPKALELLPSVDVLTTLRHHAKPNQIFLGFAAESVDATGNPFEELELKAMNKLKSKNLDFVFANGLGAFGGNTNAGVLVKKSNTGVIRFELQDKKSLAKNLLNQITQSK